MVKRGHNTNLILGALSLSSYTMFKTAKESTIITRYLFLKYNLYTLTQMIINLVQIIMYVSTSITIIENNFITQSLGFI